MNVTTILPLLENYKERFQEKFFPNTPPSDWHAQRTEFNKYSVRTTFSKEDTTDHTGLMNLMFEHYPKFNGLHLWFYHPHYGTRDGEKMRAIYEDFKCFLAEQDLDVFIILNYWDGRVMELDYLYDFSYYIGYTGENSKHLLSLIDGLAHIKFAQDMSPTLYFSKKFTHFPIALHPELKKLVVTTDQGKVDISSLEDVKRVLGEIASITENLEAYEAQVIDYAVSLNHNTYYDRKTANLYIYNKKVPFYLAKVFNGRRSRYRLRIGRGYYLNDDVNELLEKAKKEIDRFIKNNRIKSAVNGSASDLLSKFLHVLFGHNMSKESAMKKIVSSLGEDELRQKINEAKEKLKKTVLPEPYLDFIQYHLRAEGSRVKLKEAVSICDLYLFVSSSKVFIFTKEELENITLPNCWRKKEEIEMVKSLNEWKKETICS